MSLYRYLKESMARETILPRESAAGDGIRFLQ